MNSKSPLMLAMLIAVGVTLSASGGRTLATVFDDESAWLPEVEELLVASVYSTPDSAARHMARMLTSEIRAQASSDTPWNVTLHITRNQKASVPTESIREAFVETLLADKLVQVLDAAGSDEEAVVVNLNIEMDPSSDAENYAELQLTCQLSTTEQLAVRARFVNKPWVELPHEAERSDSDRQRICVRGLAEQPGITASRDVIHKASEQELLKRVLDHTQHRVPSQSSWARRFVRDRLARDIVDHPIVADRFQQTFTKNIDGEEHVVLVREAVLLDVSDENIAQLAGPMIRQLRRMRERRIGALALGGGGFLLSFVVGLVGYNVLNSLTRGYYVWRLRAATATFWLVSMTLAARMASTMFSAS